MYQNHNHLVYASWDMKCNTFFFWSFWDIFCSFTPLITWKIKVLKKWKRSLEILSFYTCVPQMKIIWCIAPEKWRATDILFCHFGPFFALLLPKDPENWNFEMKKHLDISSFYKYLSNIMVTCKVPEIWCYATD